MSDPFDIPKCTECNKDVYPPEKLIALKKPWHKWCLKCTTCKVALSVKTLESFNNMPYCRAHMQIAKMGGGTQTMRDALGSGEVISAATKVQGTNQSTENRPDNVHITYDAHNPNQSTENAPVASAFAEQRQAAAKPQPKPVVRAAPTPAPAPAAAPAARPQPPKAAAHAPAPAPAPAPKFTPPPPRQPEPEPEPEPAAEEWGKEEPQAQAQSTDDWEAPVASKSSDDWETPVAAETAYEDTSADQVAEQFDQLSIGATVLATYTGDGNQYEATIDDVQDGQYLVNYGAAFNNETEWLTSDKIQAQ